MLALFDCMNYCFLIKILLKDISVFLSSVSSIPTSKTCNFFRRHFYTQRLKIFWINIDFAIEWYIIWLHLTNFTNSQILGPNQRLLTKWPRPIKGKWFFLSFITWFSNKNSQTLYADSCILNLPPLQE